MYTDQGNRAVEEALHTLYVRIDSGEVRRGTLESDVTKTLNSVGKDHGEVWDTTVRELVYNEVDVWCDQQKWKRLYE